MVQYYNPNNVEHARNLRKNMTPWERKLWYEFLRNYSVRFQRQKPIDCFIVDFYCAAAKLAVELDGGGHYDIAAQEADRRRSEQLRLHHVTVLRFCNTDIQKHFYEVCTVIDETVQRLLKGDQTHV